MKTTLPSIDENYEYSDVVKSYNFDMYEKTVMIITNSILVTKFNINYVSYVRKS